MKVATSILVLLSFIPLSAPGAATESAPSLTPRELMISLPPTESFGAELQTTHVMLNERRSPLWVSDDGGTDVNCGGLDLFEVFQAAESGPVEVTAHMLGSPDLRLRVGPRLQLQFKSAENRAKYIALVAAGRAIPAYACWCAFGLGHPTKPHLAAPNRAVVTLRVDHNGRSGMFFNLRERFASWSADPDACIARSEVEAAKVLKTLGVEIKRPFDRIFDTPPNSRALPIEKCPVAEEIVASRQDTSR